MNTDIQSYLSFSAGGNTFGVNVTKVIEIQEYHEPKSVPESIPFVTGVVDHRNKVIPVIDTAKKFNLGETKITPQTCIVVLEIDKPDSSGVFHIGITVDEVSDVFESDPEKIKKIEDDYKPGYIDATYKVGDNLIMILNTNKVFNDKDIIALGSIIQDL